MTGFTASDLPISDNGEIYHLNIQKKHLAPDIIIVGDPDRVAAIAGRPNLCFGGELKDGDPWEQICSRQVGTVAESLLVEIEYDFCHRGLRTITGVSRDGNRVTLTTSGMGTSTEIVLNEIIALNEVNFDSRKRMPEWRNINIVRVGTSGGLRKETALGTAIISKYAVGLDGAGLFYEVPGNQTLSTLEQIVEQAVRSNARPNSRFAAKIAAYAAQASPLACEALEQAAAQLKVASKLGITVSNSGFFAAQGRDVGRVPPSVPDIDGAIADLDPQLEGLYFENMEMEAALLFHLMGGHRYCAGAVCVAIANRREDTFDHDYLQSTLNATQIALRGLSIMRNQK